MQILVEVPTYRVLEPVPHEQIQMTSEFAQKCLKILEEYDPVRRILLVESDVLGEYCYKILPSHPPEYPFKEHAEIPGYTTIVNPAMIRLYWAVIGFIAQWEGWRIEDLTIVVLTHEMAHSYTPIGADIDGRRWPAFDFERTEPELTEGLAQYYTDRVLRRLSRRYDGALNVFEELLKKQPERYRVHEGWKEYAPESVRLAMLQVRRWRTTKLRGFNDFLREAQAQIPRI